MHMPTKQFMINNDVMKLEKKIYTGNKTWMKYVLEDDAAHLFRNKTGSELYIGESTTT